MIVVINQGSEQAVFVGVQRIIEDTTHSGRKIVNLHDEVGLVIPGGDGIDLTNTEVYLLPNPERNN